jgi:hypothetical protein
VTLLGEQMRRSIMDAPLIDDVKWLVLYQAMLVLLFTRE